MSKNKEIVLTPSHKTLFWWYLLGFLLIPLFGLGIYLIYRFYTTHSSIKYLITDRSIESVDSKMSAKIDLRNIVDVEVDKRWIDKKFGIGDLTLKTANRQLRLIGLHNPDRLGDMIIQSAEAERKRLESIKTGTQSKTEHKPGTLDKLDYLTGLWQQGILSNEDYKKEKKNFE